eukprot:GHUV01016210.1.p1 GENE.GHUV01016210.1~~GHUV01016210.1.p1  ORF type:complete len:748 (+),score=249.62 GHUV01016210.1:490-2733(+)
MFLVGRFVAGIGAGAASLYVPRYIAEISPPRLRGWLGSLNQVLINTGILAALCTGIPYEIEFTGFDAFGGNVWISWWRIMLAAGLIPAVLQVVLMTTCPESPAWLEQVGRRDASDDACIKLWGPHALLPDPDYEADAARAADLVTSASQHLQLRPSLPTALSSSLATPLLDPVLLSRARSLPQHLQASQTAMGSIYSPRLGYSVTTSSTQNRSRQLGSGTEAGEAASNRGLEGWESLFARRYRLMMALAVGLPLLQQASGINTVVYYSSKVFAAAGLKSAITASIITGGVNLVFTVASASVLDRFGRKPLLLLSYLGMAFALGAVSGVSVMPLPLATSGMLMVVLVLLYVAFFATGSGPISWVVLSEVLPPRIKGPAASLATAAAWIGNLTVTLSFDTLMKHMGLGGTYLLYALLNGAAAGYVAALLVETRCRTLQEIESLLLLPDVDPRLAALYPALQRSHSEGSSGGVGVSRGGSPAAPRPAQGIGVGIGGSSVARNSVSGFYSHQLSHRDPATGLQHTGWGLQQPVLGAVAAPYVQAYVPPGATVAAASAAAAGIEAQYQGQESLMQLPSAAAVAASLTPVATSGHLSQQCYGDAGDLQEHELPSALPDMLQAGLESSVDDLVSSRQDFVTEWAHGASAEAAAAAAAAVSAAEEEPRPEPSVEDKPHLFSDSFLHELDLQLATEAGPAAASKAVAGAQQHKTFEPPVIEHNGNPRTLSVDNVNGIVTITGFIVPGEQSNRPYQS